MITERHRWTAAACSRPCHVLDVCEQIALDWTAMDVTRSGNGPDLCGQTLIGTISGFKKGCRSFEHRIEMLLMILSSTFNSTKNNCKS